ncbi:hypothetical protein [Rubellicoccus peritrichatus]|uniref:Uncharacterized protein n=1 Tax=Rubellicoccus peritrichatus TaxID=3080537 RepID=A0AAQ3L607_9BACT|nr:hypothetical protein [Puniceicoccus sp. CR14]WOO39402.1 hypothetical protein RZN69_12325 [Puniceicoccus sp. CR14]
MRRIIEILAQVWVLRDITSGLETYSAPRMIILNIITRGAATEQY